MPSAPETSFPDAPYISDPGNAVYHAVVRRLLLHVAEKEPEAYRAMTPWGLENLNNMAKEKSGDVCEALLAAANMEADAEQGVASSWSCLRGGSAPSGDVAVPLLVRLVAWQYTHDNA